jgi:hypothetical protein
MVKVQQQKQAACQLHGLLFLSAQDQLPASTGEQVEQAGQGRCERLVARLRLERAGRTVYVRDVEVRASARRFVARPLRTLAAWTGPEALRAAGAALWPVQARPPARGMPASRRVAS